MPNVKSAGTNPVTRANAKANAVRREAHAKRRCHPIERQSEGFEQSRSGEAERRRHEARARALGTNRSVTLVPPSVTRGDETNHGARFCGAVRVGEINRTIARPERTGVEPLTPSPYNPGGRERRYIPAG